MQWILWMIEVLMDLASSESTVIANISSIASTSAEVKGMRAYWLSLRFLRGELVVYSSSNVVSDEEDGSGESERVRFREPRPLCDASK